MLACAFCATAARKNSPRARPQVKLGYTCCRDLAAIARGMAAFGPLERLADALPLQFLSSTMVGPDLRLIARIQGRSRF